MLGVSFARNHFGAKLPTSVYRVNGIFSSIVYPLVLSLCKNETNIQAFFQPHDVKSYYHWFVLKTLGNTVVSLINALLELRKIKTSMSKYHEDLDILHSWKCMYTFLWYFLLTWVHYVLFMAMIVYYWAWVYFPREDIVYLGYCFVWLTGAFQLMCSRSYSFTIFPSSQKEYHYEEYQNKIIFNVFRPSA